MILTVVQPDDSTSDTKHAVDDSELAPSSAILQFAILATLST